MDGLHRAPAGRRTRGDYSQQAKSSRADLIVMETHGRGALKSLIVGSVTQKVISTNSLPATVVR
jgi:nucleotide-binding universal stress UspA family protein